MPMTTAPVEIKEPDLSEITDLDLPWKVLVWNDPINLMSYVSLRLPEAVRLQPGKGPPAHAGRPLQGQGGRLARPEGEGRAGRVPPPRARLVGDHGARQLSPLLPRRLIKRDRQGGYSLHLSADDREVLRQLVPQFRELLDEPGPARPVPAVSAGLLRDRPTPNSKRSTAG